MEIKKYNTVETIRKSIIKVASRGKIDTSNTQIHDCSLSLSETGHSMQSGGVKLVLLA
jgi:hypothetical protein